MPDPSGGGDGGGVKPSPPARPLFTRDEERDMVIWMTRCAALGLVITREMFLEEVRRIVRLEQRGDKSVGVLDQWISEFRGRHGAELGPSVLLPASKAAEREAGRSARFWFRSVNAALATRRRSADRSPFSNPQRVLYMGEVNLRLDPRTASVAELRQTLSSAGRVVNDNVAFVQAVSASGDRAPPMLVLPAGELVRDDLGDGDACFRQTTDTGRVTPTALIQYMVKSLEPYLTTIGVPRPVLLYVDGLRHHCSMTLTQFCDDEGIILVGLPPGGQARNPLQQAVTSLLVANFDRLVAEARLGRRRAGPAGEFTMSLKYLLAGINQACRRVCAQTVAQAFTSSSLFPWGEAVVAACGPADGLPKPPASPEPEDKPVTNGTPLRTPGKTDTPRRAPGKKDTPLQTPAKKDTPRRTVVPSPAAPASVPGRPEASKKSGPPRPSAVSRTVVVCQPDPELVIKCEQLSPPRSSTEADWNTDLLAGAQSSQRNSQPHGQQNKQQSSQGGNQRSKQQTDQRSTHSSDRTSDRANGRTSDRVMDTSDIKSDRVSPPDQVGGGQDPDDEPDELVLPQARLTEYLAALEAAGQALRTTGGMAQQAAVVLELKKKLRALHTASSALSSDHPELGPPPMSCAVPGCTTTTVSSRVSLHRLPSDPGTASVWLQRCGLPPQTTPTDPIGVCQLHFTGADLLPTRSPGGAGQLRPTAVPSRKLDRTSSAPASPSRPTEGRSARGIKRPKRFDDFECVDDAPLRPAAASPLPSASPAAASPDMTELANKPPAALKSIIRILRTENADLREQLESERRRGEGVVRAMERLAKDYRAGSPP